MKDGFIKIALSSPRVTVGDVCANVREIEAVIREAAKQGAGLVVFPELCLTGATCADLFKQDALVASAKEGLCYLAGLTKDLSVAVAVGLPYANRGKVVNVAAVLCAGKVAGLVPCRTASGVFAPYALGTELVKIDGYEVPMGNLIFSVEGAPDISFGLEVGADANGAIPTQSYLAEAGANLVCTMGARPATVGSAQRNLCLQKMRSYAAKTALAFVGAGPTESVTDAVYSGERSVCSLGEELKSAEFLTTGITYADVDLGAVAYAKREDVCDDGAFTRVELDLCTGEVVLTDKVDRFPFIAASNEKAIKQAREALTIASRALARRIAHIGAKSLVLGISGGLDSTLAILVCARAADELNMDRKAIKALSMPGFGTSKKTRGNAEIISERLGTDFKEISIEGAVRRHFEDIGHDETVRDVTYENSQARERTQILMDYANKTGGIVVGTGDLSEVALGFATYNGDHMSMYGVNASVPKTMMRNIITVAAGDMADEVLKNALLDVVSTPVSPELLPTDGGKIAQITEDIVGPYELHDFFIYHVIMRGARPRKVLRLARQAFDGVYDDETIKKWLKKFLSRFFSQQFKRSCMPDGVKVTDVSLSPRGAWNMPSEASANVWLKEIE